MNKNEKFVITINRELGSGGRTVGRKLAEALGVKFYDKALIEGLTKEFGLTVDEIEKIKARKNTWWNEFNTYYMKLNSTTKPMEAETVLTTETMMETEKRILQELAAEESCVVAGRSGFLVFRDTPNHMSIFIQASMEFRISRLMSKKQISRKEAIAIIEKVDKGRETYIQKYADTSRYDTRNYDLVINMDELTEDQAVTVIMTYIECTMKT
ncbi:MAG: cytidylate kinase-like family protein [Prevotella sp.]|nr:cytidylate kinase-like family protein [Prevotella sp.]